ncbi:MAG: hypothetical protein CL944_02215 [Candidatus Diapherotrites archaeon]|uniref:Uncharacterized protein n=1 Tax=Candidatus Iainarchaeum sp. TaxID=3101447 RepID=A0A2D6LQ01_9ARCH|nr:hypothetical protein [Candidatus Diapherotrites archaeon]|tara:strand:- start:15849 stop:16106 length:258 start_codon:yes stop_codon:yes gene_type:complete
MIKKKKEGKPLPVTADMKIWKEDFDQMSIEEHDKILKNLGLDDEDIDEFNEDFKGEIPEGGKNPEESEGSKENKDKTPAKKTKKK